MTLKSIISTDNLPFSRTLWIASGILFLIALLVGMLLAQFQSVPGYMDAEYYDLNGRLLFEGRGFQEPYIWNYLNNPDGLPVPMFSYWMPLPALLSYLGMFIFQTSQFWASRFPFVLLYAIIPFLTMQIAFLLHGDTKKALLSGILSLAAGFYLPYLLTTDSFGPYMVLGGIFCLLIIQINRTDQNQIIQIGGLGLCAGLMHLCRADGVLWLIVGILFVLWVGINKKQSGTPAYLIRIGTVLLVFLIGYFLPMLAWFVRNFQLWGTIFPPGGSKTIWLTEYNQTYYFPASELTAEHWLNSGWKNIIEVRLNALKLNSLSVLAVQGYVFLLPCILIGFWNLRKTTFIRIACLAWLLVMGIMTVVFPFAGSRGGYFHSSSAFQSLLWAVAPIGLEACLRFLQRIRKWNYRQAWKVFSIAMIVFCLAITAGVFIQKVLPEKNGGWSQSWQNEESNARWLAENAIPANSVLMVNNPPGFYSVSERPCIVIPDGTVENLLSAARKYQAEYLILTPDQVNLEQLYESDGEGDLKLIGQIGTSKIFKIHLNQP